MGVGGGGGRWGLVCVGGGAGDLCGVWGVGWGEVGSVGWDGGGGGSSNGSSNGVGWLLQ